MLTLIFSFYLISASHGQISSSIQIASSQATGKSEFRITRIGKLIDYEMKFVVHSKKTKQNKNSGNIRTPQMSKILTFSLQKIGSTYTPVQLICGKITRLNEI